MRSKSLVTLWFLLYCAMQLRANAQQTDDRVFMSFVINRALEVNQADLTDRDAVRVFLGLAEGCEKVDKPELAQTFLNRAEDISSRDGKNRYQYELFDCALKFNNLDKAREIALGFGPQKDHMLDRLDLERFARGDRDAIKNVPRVELDFFGAIRLGNAYVKAGDLKAAEKFIDELDIPHKENDPRAIAGFIFCDIARICRQRGDLKEAKQYADKAMRIAGRLYYSGYGVEITKRSIYGQLTTGLDEFAQLGANHQRHQGREFVRLLISELIATEHLAEAKRTTKYLKQQKDIDSVLKRIVIAQAENGDIKAAQKTIGNLEDSSDQSLARMDIAAVLWRIGDKDAATEMALSEYKTISRETWTKANDPQFQRLGVLFGQMRRKDELNSILEQSSDAGHKAYCLMSALDGF